MDKKLNELDEFARSTLGETPELVEMLGILNSESAEEQFQENLILYLGRKNLPKKIVPLIALSVSLGNGQNDSAIMHYRLAKKFGANNLEILDAIRATKMALMANTLSTISVIEPMVSGPSAGVAKNAETEKILENIAKNSNVENVPENLKILSRISFDLFNEHIREQNSLFSPFAIERKYVYLIAFSVSSSLSDIECTRAYLTQFFKFGGNNGEMEDAMAVTRFIRGNRAITSATEILKIMATGRDGR